MYDVIATSASHRLALFSGASYTRPTAIKDPLKLVIRSYRCVNHYKGPVNDTEYPAYQLQQTQEHMRPKKDLGEAKFFSTIFDQLQYCRMDLICFELFCF